MSRHRPIGRLCSRPFAERAQPFVEAGVFEAGDLQIVDLLARLGGETRPDVLLALALVVRAPRHGHVGIRLPDAIARLWVELPIARPLGKPGADLTDLPWPSPFESWQREVEESPLVGSAESEAIPFISHEGLLYARRYFDFQRRLAIALRERARGSGHLPVDADSWRRIGSALSKVFGRPPGEAFDRQRLAGGVALLSRFTVVTGGPGTGKTHTVKKILASVFTHARDGGEPDPRVAVCAPTGKAAARLAEAMVEGLDDLPVDAEVRRAILAIEPTTIHRLLGVDPRLPGGFRHHLDAKLHHDVVVVDEASMIDLPTTCKLVEAVRDDARLLLLGDRHQLASVEAGSVLSDLTSRADVFELRRSEAMIEALEAVGAAPEGALSALSADTSAISDCIVQLRKAHRFREESGVGSVAALIAKGGAAERREAVALLAGETTESGAGPFQDLRLIPHDGSGQVPEAALPSIVDGYRPFLEALRRGAEGAATGEASHRKALALFDRFRILCAHRRGHLGVAGLSSVTEVLLRREGLLPGESGEPFYLGRPILITRNSHEVGLMNGDIGIVVRRTDGRITVVFSKGEGGLRYVAPARLPAHQTVWAMTIHKSQGSQIGHPLIVLPSRPSPILTRELVYTALTRASLRATIVGDRALLLRALETKVQRASGLGAMLWDGAR